MKKYLFIAIILLAVSSLQAQSKFGIATYSVPAGWQASEQATAVTLVNQMSEGQVCRIIISATESIAVNDIYSHVRQRTAKNNINAIYDKDIKSVVLTEANGLISLSSGGTTIMNGLEVRTYFYSFTNRQSTFFIQFITCDNDCTQAFNSFLTGLKIDTTDNSTSNDVNLRRRKKVASAAAPAAPVPLM